MWSVRIAARDRRSNKRLPDNQWIRYDVGRLECRLLECWLELGITIGLCEIVSYGSAQTCPINGSMLISHPAESAYKGRRVPAHRRPSPSQPLLSLPFGIWRRAVDVDVVDVDINVEAVVEHSISLARPVFRNPIPSPLA